MDFSTLCRVRIATRSTRAILIQAFKDMQGPVPIKATGVVAVAHKMLRVSHPRLDHPLNQWSRLQCICLRRAERSLFHQRRSVKYCIE